MTVDLLPEDETAGKGSEKVVYACRKPSRHTGCRLSFFQDVFITRWGLVLVNNWWGRSHQGRHIRVCHLCITERCASVPADDGIACWKSYFRAFEVKFRNGVVKTQRCRFYLLKWLLHWTPRHFIARQAVRSWNCAPTMGRTSLEPSGSGTITIIMILIEKGIK